MKNKNVISEKKIVNNRELEKYLNILNKKLREKNMIGEVYLCGKTVLYLVLNYRDITQDIDLVLQPKVIIINLIKEIAIENNLSQDWLNNGVKSFIFKNNEMIIYNKLENLIIKTATPGYLFAMKCLSCKTQKQNDMEDIKLLFEHLNLNSVKDALDIIYQYYDQKRFNQSISFVLKEISDELKVDYSDY
jgi:hypothetical protein